MSPAIRRIIYVISYEAFAILITTFGLIVLGFGGGSSGVVAVVTSTIAVIWNYIWTSFFEMWERKQPSQVRTIPRRIAHAVGFEGGLIIFLVPTIAFILRISLLEALILDIGLLIFFLIYTFIFAWLFDKVLPLRKLDAQPENGEELN